MSDKRDYVQETYDAFIKDAQDIEPTDPVKAVEMYFAAHASDELKARCETEGKTAAKCWKFIEEVARKIGNQCHIDPAVVYAMCMHYFEDVPVDWRGKVKGEEEREKGEGEGEKSEGVKSKGEREKSEGERVKSEGEREKGEEVKPEPKPKKVKAKRNRTEQGFFFDVLEGGAE